MYFQTLSFKRVVALLFSYPEHSAGLITSCRARADSDYSLTRVAPLRVSAPGSAVGGPGACARAAQSACVSDRNQLSVARTCVSCDGAGGRARGAGVAIADDLLSALGAVAPLRHGCGELRCRPAQLRWGRDV